MSAGLFCRWTISLDDDDDDDDEAIKYRNLDICFSYPLPVYNVLNFTLPLTLEGI